MSPRELITLISDWDRERVLRGRERTMKGVHGMKLSLMWKNIVMEC